MEGSKQGTRSSITIISTLLFVTELDYPNNMLQFPGIQTARNSLLSNLNLKNKKKLKWIKQNKVCEKKSDESKRVLTMRTTSFTHVLNPMVRALFIISFNFLSQIKLNKILLPFVSSVFLRSGSNK